VPLSRLYHQFEIGDLVRENEVIAFYDESPMIGVIINIRRGFYCFYYGSEALYQDELTIRWIDLPRVEFLPSDLVHLVSRAQK
jgi:hypothetical protein